MQPLDHSNNPSITISYHTCPSPDVWERIQADLCRQLPLKNLSWKPTTRSAKIIPSLPISFQPFSSITSSLSSASLVHLLFVACDDLEAYRTIIKDEIRTWLDSVQSHQSEWLIVHVSTASKPHHPTPGIFRTKTGVLDKLKTDFNPQKKDRCVSLSYMSTMDTIVHASVHDPSTTQWTELINRLKEILVIALDLKINEMDESLRMLLSKRTRLGWDFETFFIQKAQLANQFQTMNLLEDSLIQYEELDAAFFQSLSDQSQIWHSKVFGKNSSQYSNLALNVDYSEQYLEWVGSGQMSIFDLRIYLLSKQLNLLARLGRLDEAIQRAKSFLTTFSAFLKSHQPAWPPNFLESWIYFTSIQVVEWCEAQLNPANDGPARLSSLRCRAELLELAHIQLDRIGIQVGHLPSMHPFNMSLSHQVQRFPSSKPKPSSPTIVDVPFENSLASSMNDSDTFEKAYLDLARRTINLYQLSNRRRFALKLHCKIAAFELIRNRYESAHRLFSHLPVHYVDDKWTTIESSLLDKCATLQKQLGLSREWLLSTLALVRSGVAYEPGKWSQDVMLIGPSSQFHQVSDTTIERINLATQLMNDIKEQSQKLEKDFAALGFPTFSIGLNSPFGRLCHQNKLGSIVEVKIKNLLPCSIEVEAVRIKFSGKKYETLWFTAGTSQLLPGETTIDLFCATPVAETLVLDVSQIRIGRILFQYHHHSISSSQQAHSISNAIEKLDEPQKFSEIVSFPQDLLGLDVKLDLPYDLHLDLTKSCLVKLFSGRNHLSQAIISICSSASPITFDFTQSQLCERFPSKSCLKALNSFQDKIILEGIEANSNIYICVPFHTSTNKTNTEVDISVDYRISIEESVKRTFRKTCPLFFSVPAQIETQQFFRFNCVFVNFTIGSDGFNPIRINDAKLVTQATSDNKVEEESGPSLVRITPKLLTRQPSMGILPGQTTNYSFKLTTTSSEVSLSKLTGSSHKLIIRYRLLLDEVLEFLKDKLMNGLTEEKQKEKLPHLMQEVKNSLSKRINEGLEGEFYQNYLDDHVIDSSRLLKLNWHQICSQVEEDYSELTALVEKIREVLKDSYVVNRESDLTWRTISMPFKLSKSTILATIDYRQEGQEDKVVGKPMGIHLSISTSFKWFHHESSHYLNHMSDPPVLAYELLSKPEDWLIGGSVKGRFLARENEAKEIKLVLIPLRPGYLQIPEVRIRLKKEGKSPTQATKSKQVGNSHQNREGDKEKNDNEVEKDEYQDKIQVQCHHSNLFHPILVFPSSESAAQFFFHPLGNFYNITSQEKRKSN